MNKKLLGVFISMLFIATIVFPATSSVDISFSSKLSEVKDQYQESVIVCDPIISYAWQEFVPTLERHTRVEVKIVQWYSRSPDIRLSIEGPLGSVLSYKDLPVEDIPYGHSDWVSFDIPDVDLIPGQSYYINLTAPPGSEYGWESCGRDSYPRGVSSKAPGWDWCFRTFCDDDPNLPPARPEAPSGETSGETDTFYPYTTCAVDPNGDEVTYGWDWDGDDIVDEWTDFHDSGETITTYHSWAIEGTYTVQVKAKDTDDAESDWATLEVTMPKTVQMSPFGFIFVLGLNVDIKLVQLEPGENYVDLEVMGSPLYIWENGINTISQGAFVRLYIAQGLFLPISPVCFGMCQDWGIIG